MRPYVSASGRFALSNTLIIVGGMAVMVAACLFALMRGGRPERAAAVWMLGTFVAAQMGAAVFGETALPLVVLSCDGVLATALLFISIQWSSLWLGGAMLLQSSAFALHAWFLTDGGLDRIIYVTSINLLSVTIITLLVASTASRWIRRVRARRVDDRRAPSLRPVVSGLT